MEGSSRSTLFRRSAHFVFNADSPAFTDPDVRRAVAFAIDRRALARYTGLGETGQPTDQLLPPGIPGYEDAAIYPLDGPDLATARRLAGTARRDAVLYTCNLPECTRHAQILRSNLAAIGIELDVRLFPLGEFFERIHTPGEPWDIAYTNWFVDHPDPANYINDLFGMGGQVTGVGHDPSLERRMDEAVLLTGDQRYEAYAELDRDLTTDLVPAVTFATGVSTHFVSARVGCEVLHPSYSLDLAALCIDDEE